MRTVSEIMTADPACCTPEAELQEVAQMMLECNCGEIPVVDSLESMIPRGVITDRDIVVRAVAEGRNPLRMRAIDCMTSPALTVGEDADLEDCLQIMEQNQIRRVPVVDAGGRLVGIVAQADIAAATDPETTAEVVREVSQPANDSYAAH